MTYAISYALSIAATTFFLFAIFGPSIAFHPTNVSISQSKAQSRTKSTPEKTFEYDTAGVSLEGILSEQTFYGPPGFGETPSQDVKEKVLVLVLRNTITVRPAERVQPENIAMHVREIQLLILPKNRNDSARKLLGKSVMVTGTLNEPTAPSEHLRVSMTVKILIKGREVNQAGGALDNRAGGALDQNNL